MNARYLTLTSETFVIPQFGMGASLFFSSAKEVIDFGRRMPLSFHSISFGLDSSASFFNSVLLSYHSPSIRRDPSFYLRRMAELALEIQKRAPRDPLTPSTASVPSSFFMTLDTVSDKHDQS